MTAILLALVLLILLCRCGRAWAVDDALAFEGSPREIGALWGRTNAAHIAEDMQKAFLDPAAAHEIHQDELLRRNDGLGRQAIEIRVDLPGTALDHVEAAERADRRSEHGEGGRAFAGLAQWGSGLPLKPPRQGQGACVV